MKENCTLLIKSLILREQDQKSIDAIKAIVYFNNLNIQEMEMLDLR